MEVETAGIVISNDGVYEHICTPKPIVTQSDFALWACPHSLRRMYFTIDDKYTGPFGFDVERFSPNNVPSFCIGYHATNKSVYNTTFYFIMALGMI
jgi:hypothetical protein